MGPNGVTPGLQRTAGDQEKSEESDGGLEPVRDAVLWCQMGA